MDPLSITLMAGAGLQAFGQYQAGQAQARAAKQQAKLKKAQAKEMLERMYIEETRLHEKGEAFKADQTTQYAASGVALGTGATLVAMEDTNMKITQSVQDMRRDTLYKVEQIKLGASYDLQQGRNASTSGSILAAGSILEGFADYQKTT
jgi:hypothetical protein